MEQTVPAGTVVHIGGFPFELVADTVVISATPVSVAMQETNDG